MRRSSGTGSSGAGAVGRDGVCAARHAAPFEPDPWGAGRVDGPGPSDRGHGRCDAPARRHGPDLAHRPAGDGDHAGHPGRPGELRPGGQALRGGRRALPAAARQPQGLGGVRGAVHLGTLVAADDARDPEEAQLSLDRFLAGPGDARERRTPAGADNSGRAGRC